MIIKIHKTIILPVILYGCETWSPTVFENRALWRIFGLSGRKWRETGEDCIMRKFITYTLHQNIIRVIKSTRRGGTCSTDGRDEKYI
jgi:hypothetical protein